MQALCYLLYWDLLWCVVSCCLHEFPLQLFLRDREGDGESGLKEQRAMQVVETVKILGWWDSNYWPETTILRLGIDEFIYIYIWFLYFTCLTPESCWSVLLMPNTTTLGFVLLGSWGVETVALKSIIGVMGAQLQRNWHSFPSISPWKKLERNAGMPLITQHPHFHAVPIPL